MLKRQTVYYVSLPAQRRRYQGAGTHYQLSHGRVYAAVFTNGILATIGKGHETNRYPSHKARRSTLTHRVSGAYYKNCIKLSSGIFPELGTEAVYRLEVEDFPA